MAVSVDLKDFEKDINNIVNKHLPAGVERGLSLVAEAVRAEATARSPYDTGWLGEHINKEIRRTAAGVEAYVGTNVQYAIYVHEGTGIYAKKGSLAKKIPWVYWDSKKGEFIATKGNKPQPFLTDALRVKQPQIRELILRGLRNA